MKKTYTRWNLDQTVRLARGVLNLPKGVVDLDFSDSKVVLLEKEPGPTLHGMNTTYYKYQTKYDLQIKVLGMKRFYAVEMTHEVWLTQDAKDLALGVWRRNEPPSTGREGLDKLFAAEMSRIRGFVLKSHTQTRMLAFNKKRTRIKKETHLVSEALVEEWRSMPMPPSNFEIPDDYREVEITGEANDAGQKSIFKSNNL